MWIGGGAGAARPERAARTQTTADGQPVRPVELHAAVRQLEAGIEPLEREAAPGGPVYAIAGLVLPVAGVWHVQVETLISDFEKVRPSAGIHLH